MIGKARFECGVDAFVRIGRIVAAVLHHVHRQDADVHVLGIKRHQQRIDLQIVDRHIAKSEPVKKGDGFGEPLGNLHRAFLAFCAERPDIARIVIKDGEVDIEIAAAEKARGEVVERAALLQCREAAAKGDGVADAEGIDAADVQGNARAETGRAFGTGEICLRGSCLRCARVPRRNRR